MACKYRIVYDILHEGIGGDWVFLAIAMLGGAIIGVIVLRHQLRERQRGRILFGVVWLIVWIGIGGFITGHLITEHRRCLSWAKSGEFRIVEGKVRNFIPYRRGDHNEESFTVGDASFSYSDYDLNHGGFRNMAPNGGPMREGLAVRIAYREGRILKIEVCE